MPLEVSVDEPGDNNRNLIPRASIVVDLDHESAMRESVHGTDDRARVTFFTTITTKYPWNTVCYLDFMSGGDSYRGSGVLIAPYCVLTCGHNVWDQDLNDWSDNVLVTPAQYQAYQGASIYEPYGTIADTILASNTKYTNSDNPGGLEYDYGVVKLPRSFPGISTFIPIEYDATPTAVNVVGYPAAVQGESNSYDMWKGYGSVIGYEGTNNRIMLHQGDTSPGESGAPVWRYRSGSDGTDSTRRLVAIHVYGEPGSNGACRLVSAIEHIISRWMEYEPVEPTYTNFSYFPYFSTSSNRWTGLALANYNDRSNSVKVDYYAANADHLGSEYKSLAANGQGLVVVAASAPEGWVKISSTAPLKGLALIGEFIPGTMYDIDLKNTLHRKFLFSQLASNEDWNSYVMVCNPNSSVASVTFKYYNSSGISKVQTTRSIPSNGSINYAISTFFHNDFTDGTMVLESSQPVTAFLLYENESQNWKAGLSAVPVN